MICHYALEASQSVSQSATLKVLKIRYSRNAIESRIDNSEKKNHSKSPAKLSNPQHSSQPISKALKTSQ